MLRIIVELVLFVSLLFYVACFNGGPEGLEGTPSNSNVSTAMISADTGGSLTSPDGKLTLEIPPGALDEDTEITINSTEGPSGAEYNFEPEGLVFKQPAIAHYEMEIDSNKQLLDENGEELDLKNSTPDVKLFLRSADGSLEILDNTEINHEAGNHTISVTAPIPHFTSMLTAVGNSYYVYLSSLGAHYEGTSFKRDASARYLGYIHTDSYQNMSISYKVKSITVKKITIETSGKIGLVTPNNITRNDFLNKRGQESATRPKFSCTDVGEGSAKVTFDVESGLEITLKPENKTFLRTISQSQSITRKGKCLKPFFGMNDNNVGGEGEEIRVAMADPTGDYSVWTDGALEPVGFVEVPGMTDYSQVFMSLHNGEALEANFAVNAQVPEFNPDYLQYLSFNLAVINDETNESSQTFSGASGILAFEAVGPGAEPLPVFYEWDPEFNQWQINEDVEFETALSEEGLSFLIQLEDLGLSGEEALDTSYRGVSFIRMAEGYAYSDNIYADTVELSF